MMAFAIPSVLYEAFKRNYIDSKTYKLDKISLGDKRK